MRPDASMNLQRNGGKIQGTAGLYKEERSRWPGRAGNAPAACTIRRGVDEKKTERDIGFLRWRKGILTEKLFSAEGQEPDWPGSEAEGVILIGKAAVFPDEGDLIGIVG